MALIDVHTHLGQFAHSNQSADGKRLCEMLRVAGVTHAIAFSGEACYGGIELGNRYVFNEVQKHGMLSMLLVLHPHHYANSVELLNEFGEHPKVVGVKFHPHLGGYHVLDADLVRLIEKEVAPRGLPVLSHVANDAPNVQARDFLRLAAQFPQTRFVGAHLGIGLLGDAHCAINLLLAGRPANVWLDMATLRVFVTGILKETLEAVGSGRLCFGTDAPLYHPAAFTRILDDLGLDPEGREKIAWKSALEVFPRLGARGDVRC